MSTTLALAARLRGLPDPDLLAGLARRPLGLSASALAGIADFFDLADALLEPSALQQCLARLDRGTLAVLAVLGAGPELTPASIAERYAGLGGVASADIITARLERAAVLFLVQPPSGPGEGWETFEGVRALLSPGSALGLPGLAELVAEPAPGVSFKPSTTPNTSTDVLAAEAAFAALGSTAELLHELHRQPARELAKGGVAMPDTRRLAAALRVEPAAVAAHLELAEQAGLLGREPGWRLTTPAGVDWLLLPSPERWRALAVAWAAGLSAEFRELLAAASVTAPTEGLDWAALTSWLYPAGGEWSQQRAERHAHQAELLGITARRIPSTPGALLLGDSNGHAASAALAGLLPAEIEQVYLQHDLTVIAPGPLTPAVDERMRRLADLETRGLATSYRVSAASLGRALAGGESAASLREFLLTHSLTGIPQPLDYLLAEADRRHGIIRVGPSEPVTDPLSPEYGAQSVVRCDDGALLHTVAVDQALSALRLVAVGPHRLVSRLPHETVFWMLTDARYPVAAEDATGAVIALHRHRLARPLPPAPDPLDELVTRLRRGDAERPGAPDSQAWLVKQVEASIRARESLLVSVRMPGGELVDFLLEPTGIAGGRMRARDARAEIERTLPLSSIAAVAPAP